MDIKQFFTTNYLFQIDRVMLHRSDKVFLFIGAALVALAIVFKLAAIYSPTLVDKKYRQKFFVLFLTIGLAEATWFLARYYFVRFFGSHFVASLILLIGLIWFVALVVKMIKHYREEKTVWEKEQVRAKYLPK